MLHIYNTLTKQKQLFTPLQPGKIGIYVCGITVYDYCHIGHARLCVVFDVLTRYLRAIGYEVKYVRNITDVDDKIIKRANELGEDAATLAQRFIQAMHEDERALNVLPPDIEPRATEYMSEMIAMIEKLIANHYAYIAENGDVYYQVSRFDHYGELAYQDLDKLRAGARVDVVEVKRDPLDFVLWKRAKPGEPKWPSPWGDGRPGWHIECSAMSTSVLGEHFDIHGGGLDLVFPHHTNEIAQAEGATGKKFVNVWVHNGFVQVDKEKMSKSLGNFFTIRDILAQYDAETVRYFLMASHYRSPINYSTENLQSAHAALERFYQVLRGLPKAEKKQENKFTLRFHAAMEDDFNTPIAISVLFDLVREINRLRSEGELVQAAEYGALLKYLGTVLGILQQNPEVFLRSGVDALDVEKIELLIEQRNLARQNKAWQKADEVRDELLVMGIVLEDTAEGTIWRKS